MKKLVLLTIFWVVLFLPKLVLAETISVDTVWSPTDGEHLIDSGFSVAVGATLTIEPGTIIKAKTTWYGGPSIYGKLIARGTSESPIIFTSQNGEVSGWQGLYFKEGSVGDFDFVDISYAGHGGDGFGDFVGIENDGGNVEIKNSKIHDNYKIINNGGGGIMSVGSGIYNKRGTLSVSDSVIDNNTWGIRIDSGTSTISNNIIKNNDDSTGYGRGYGVYATGPEPLTLTNNSFSGNGKTAFVDASKTFTHSGNTSSDLTNKGFEMNGTIDTNSVISGNDLPFIIGSLTINGTLTLEPGTIIKMNDYYSSGSITVNGSLIAKGTKDKKIYITSLKDDSVGGDTNGTDSTPAPRNWSSIFVEKGSVEFDNVVVRYGGYNWNGEYLNIASAIYNRGADISISNSLFEHNAVTNIYQDAGTTTISKSELTNGDYGIWSRGGKISISQSAIHNNTGLSVYNESGIDLGWWWQTKPLQIIDARNNWWGNEGGPKNTDVSSNVDYIPFLTENPLVEKRIDPVIIIPGIMGSAQKNGKLLIDPILHTYDDLIATLKANGYEENQNLFSFPYEWRDSNIITANLLKQKISAVKTACGCSKVDLVAHSMGGLVAREYIQSAQYQNDVDQIIFLGTPHKGSPTAYLQWEGAKFPPDTLQQVAQLIFSVEALKKLYPSLFDYIHNRPVSSVQELLPIFDYLKDKDTETIRTYPENYPRNVFLEALNSNTGIQKLLNSGVKIKNIVGKAGNTSTIEKIRVVPSSNSLWTDGEPDGIDGATIDHGLENGNGDTTVTTYGSTLDPSINNEIIDGTHRALPGLAEYKIVEFLMGTTSVVQIHTNIIQKLLTIQLRSPIDILITSPDGKRMGKNFETGEEYNEIEGAFYSGYQTDDEYITIPNPLDGEYKIELQGTGSGGEFGVVTNYISDESSVSKEYTDTIKPNEIKETLAVINDTNNILSLEIKTKEEVAPTPEPTPNLISTSKSGSGHHATGEVLGVSIDNKTALRLKLIECLKQLIQLYMLLLNK